MTLRSISDQQYTPIEVIISDDTDYIEHDIDDLIREYEDKLNITYVINETGRGIFNNLNNAIRHSKGSFIQIFSQDDVMKGGFLESQTASFDVDPRIGMVFSAYEEIDEDNQLILTTTRKFFNPGRSTIILPKEITDMFVKYGCFVGNISPVMIRRELIETVGYFNENLKYAADFEYWIRISYVYPLYFNSKIGVSVRNHPKRASHLISSHQLLSDLVYIYTILLDRMPEAKRSESLVLIDKHVGASFVHHTLIEVLKFNWPITLLRRRYEDLSNYPFNLCRSIRYYLKSIPERILNRLKNKIL